MNDAPRDDEAITPITFSRATAVSGQRRWIRPLPAAIGVVFLLLAVAVFFMLNARAVDILVSPQPTTMEVTDGFSYSLGGRLLMLPGDYNVIATAEGHEPLNASFTVGPDADQTFEFELVRLPGILKVTTTPDTGGDVYLDQAKVGVTPLTLDAVSPGLHDITIRAQRYLQFDTELDVTGMRTEQVLNLELQRAWSNVSITTNPPGADIISAGVHLATTPAVIELLQGEHTVVLRKQGFKSWETEVVAVAGGEESLPPVDLVVADGTASINSTPSGANVTINGSYRGQTPLDLVLPPTTRYQVMLSKAGFLNVTRHLDIRAETDLSLNVPLKPIVGTINFSVRPAGATLLVDGVDRGEANQSLSLPAREHHLLISLDGHAPYETIITPQPGFAQQLLVSLKTDEQAEAERIPQQHVTALGQTMQLIIPGTMKMGAGRREPGRRANEVEKEVVLTRSYYLGIEEVTNGDFARFNPNHDSGAIGRSLLNHIERPVVNVAWDEAVRFCNWLSLTDKLEPAYEKKEGEWVLTQPVNTGYRLPTEAEWAWAARYADTPLQRFPWGETMPPPEGSANYADELAAGMVPYHIIGYKDGFRGPAPTRSFQPNPFGIYDLAGNVAEWVHDHYSAERSLRPLTDPVGPASGTFHTIRGSSFMHGRFSELRWTYREYGADPRPDVGFRIARFAE